MMPGGAPSSDALRQARLLFRGSGAAESWPSARATEAPVPTKAISGYAINVRDFGAVGDGRTLCTAGMEAAIDACAAAGGGKVFVPPGKYLTGPIFLKSNLEFGKVLAGATCSGAPISPTIRRLQGGGRVWIARFISSLITGIDLENVAITGQGTLDGQGPVWRTHGAEPRRCARN